MIKTPPIRYQYARVVLDLTKPPDPDALGKFITDFFKQLLHDIRTMPQGEEID